MFNIVRVQEEGERNRILFSNGEEYILASYSEVFDPEVLLFKSKIGLRFSVRSITTLPNQGKPSSQLLIPTTKS